MGRPPDNGDDAPPAVQRPAGKVEFDSRGNSVWRWASDLIESTSVLLKRLDNRDLSLEPTQKVPVMRGGDAGRQKPTAQRGSSSKRAAGEEVVDEKPRHPAARRAPGGKDGGGGFDPYNSR